MTEPAGDPWALFFEVFEGLPRQGPGNRASTARALRCCDGLPASPLVVDLGCGVGMQTLHLAELTGGTIVAVDRRSPPIHRLAADAARRDLAGRVRPLVADMAATGLRPGGFDLVWSEGALYALGLDVALPICLELLRPGGHLAFTDAVWRSDDPPAVVRAVFDDYPAMGCVADVEATIARCGFDLVGHFAVPEEAWWDDFYLPLEARVRRLRDVHASDPAALAVLDRLDAEVELRRAHGDHYGYEFFVARRPTAAVGPAGVEP